MSQDEILNFAVKNLSIHQEPSENLRILAENFPDKICFSSSLSLEDQVVTDLIFSNQLNITIFTLETGRLFPETMALLAETQQFYGQNFDVFKPKVEDVEKLVNEKGLFSFYESIENRKECCFIRKVEPLKRALAGKKIWITGIRAEHSENRQNMASFEWDEKHQLLKFHPILHWTFEQTKDYIVQKNIPYNPLHDKGFVSIGCQPCTRAIRAGEDFRAGRWWWENNDKKECGLH